MQFISKILTFTVLVATLSVGLTINRSSAQSVQAQSTDIEVKLSCTDTTVMSALLKQANMQLLFTGVDSTGNTIDSIAQTWTNKDGSWIMIEYIPKLKIVCILASGSKSKIADSSSKLTWI